MLPCNAYCTASSYRFEELRKYMENHYKSVGYRDAIHVQSPMEGDAFLFKFGVIVTWGMGYDVIKSILQELRRYEEGSLTEPILDEFVYSENENTTSIHFDRIMLAGSNDPVLEKLAISHGIAQSVKLDQFETEVEKTILKSRHIPERMATTGKTKLSRREISRMRGELFLVKSWINLQYDLLDTPEFFWEFPRLEESYQIAASYMEIQQRVEVLNKKLVVIHELFEMLADEQNQKYSSNLEWTIIALIAIEIAIFIIHDILKIL